MADKVAIFIQADMDTKRVHVEGNIDDMDIVHFLLGEARRICERRADKRDREMEGKEIVIGEEARRELAQRVRSPQIVGP